MKKKELLIIVIIALCACLGLVFFKVKSSETVSDGFGPSDEATGEWIAVIHRNEVALWFDSGVDDTYTLTGDYGKMTITVKDGKWCVSEVECPNHNCEQMGWDDGTNMIPITCIPNNVMICTKSVARNYVESNS